MPIPSRQIPKGPEKNAREAYRIADAMIRERDLNPSEAVEFSQETNDNREVKDGLSKQESVPSSAPHFLGRVSIGPIARSMPVKSK